MLVWRADVAGEPQETLHLVAEPEPTPRRGEVVIDVRATGLSHADLLLCRGTYQFTTPCPFYPGGESSGTVVAVGPGVRRFRVGDPVIALGGGMAELICRPIANVYPMPAGLDHAGAAALPLNFCTVHHALFTRGGLRPGETIAITGAGGGVGSAAIQLAKRSGATVIALAGGAHKAASCRAVGADHTIDYLATPRFAPLLRELTGGTGVQVCLDVVGGDVSREMRRALSLHGRHLVVGFTSGDIPELPDNHALLRSYSLIGVNWGVAIMAEPELVPRTLRRVIRMVEDAAVRPAVQTFPFRGAANALTDLAARSTFGKVVVTQDAFRAGASASAGELRLRTTVTGRSGRGSDWTSTGLPAATGAR